MSPEWTEISDESLIQVSSKVKDLNFSIGRGFAAGRDNNGSGFPCGYFYDDSVNNKHTLKYFCSDTGETTWMSNDYSSLTYRPSASSYTSICKVANYRGGLNQCWKLSNCR